MERMLEQGRSFSGRERNCCFLNTGDGKFATASSVSGLNFPDDGRAVVQVDWDQDGDLDLWISNRNAPRLRFMRNELGAGANFVAFRLVGNGRSSNRDAIGARIEVFAEQLGERRIIRTLRAGEGMLSQSSKWIHVGLGDVDAIKTVVVNWPDGATETFDEVIVNQRYRLAQGSKNAVALEPRQWDTTSVLAGDPEPQPTNSKSDGGRIPLVSLLPMPREISYRKLNGVPSTLSFDNPGRPTLVMLWASWCRPCLEELKELADHAEEISKSDLRIVALSVDGVGNDKSDRHDAARYCKSIGFPFETGSATQDLSQLLFGYHHLLVARMHQLPIPVSFLVDRKGRLSVVYKSRIQLKDVLQDAQRSEEDLLARWRAAACLDGRYLDDAELTESLRRMEAVTLNQLGVMYSNAQRHQDAVAPIKAALEVEPKFGLAHHEYAKVLQAFGKFDEAERHYQAALENNVPDRIMVLFDFGTMHGRQGQHQKAAECFAKALELDPNSFSAHTNYGMMQIELRNLDLATQHFQRALTLNAGASRARLGLQLVEQLNRPGR